MFTTWYKIKGESDIVEINNTELCGIQPDYLPAQVYFIRDSNGIQIEIPIDSISWLKFSKERYENNTEGDNNVKL